MGRGDGTSTSTLVGAEALVGRILIFDYLSDERAEFLPPDFSTCTTLKVLPIPPPPRRERIL